MEWSLETFLLANTILILASILQMATGVVDNVRSARETKKVVARIKTILNERSRAAQAGAGDKN